MYDVAKSAQQTQQEVSLTPSPLALICSLAWVTLACVALIACEPSSAPPPLVPLAPQRPQLTHISASEVRAEQQDASGRASAPQLDVRAFVLASSIQRRLPVGVNTEFSSEEPSLWAWLDLKSHMEAQTFTLRWRREGLIKASHAVELKAQQRHRLWVRLSVQPSDEGAWSVSLEDQAGRSLARRLFDVLPPSQLKAIEDQRLAYPLSERPSLSLSSPVRAQLHEERSPAQLNASPKRALPLKASAPSSPQHANTSNTSNTSSAEQLSQEQAVEPKSEVRRLVVATSIKHRRPLGVSERFNSEHERLWGYLEVRHVGPPSLLWMEWWREGELRSRLKVKVRESLRWRTWSWQRLRPQRDAGQWTLKVLTPDKEPLAKVSFEVLE
jgi:hypothetical protein